MRCYQKAACLLIFDYVKSMREPEMQLQSTITCPSCGHAATETMSTNACQFFYDCKGCGVRLKPKAGDCCVFCSFGSAPCPPVQQSGKCWG
jgi:hypothetical protein